MEKKIILIFVVLLFTIGIAFGENNTTDSVEIEDDTDYILPISITNEGIKFSDGFTGFCIDPANNNIETSDKFTLGVLGNSEIENNIKLAIIECYKQGKEDAMADILSQIDDKGSNNDVLTAVFSSSERIGNTAVVDIDDSTEATFEFEFLKSKDDAKSDCVAYKVSMKTIEKEESSNDTNEDENISNSQSDENTLAATNDDGNETPSDTLKSNETEDNEKTTENTADDKKTNEDTTNTPNDKKTSENTAKNNTSDDKKANEKTTTETNKTIVNKTNTVIVNETNTTVINKNNVKTINDTNETPENDTVTNILKTAGNPIFLLIIVIIVIALAVVVMRRKD